MWHDYTEMTRKILTFSQILKKITSSNVRQYSFQNVQALKHILQYEADVKVHY